MVILIFFKLFYNLEILNAQLFLVNELETVLPNGGFPVPLHSVVCLFVSPIYYVSFGTFLEFSFNFDSLALLPQVSAILPFADRAFLSRYRRASTGAVGNPSGPKKRSPYSNPQ